MISTDKLTKIYNNWGDKNNLQPLQSADDMLWSENLTEEQNNWLERFIYFWGIAQDNEYRLWQLNKLKEAR